MLYQASERLIDKKNHPYLKFEISVTEKTHTFLITAVKFQSVSFPQSVVTTPKIRCREVSYLHIFEASMKTTFEPFRSKVWNQTVLTIGLNVN